MKAHVGAFIQEKAFGGALIVIAKLQTLRRFVSSSNVDMSGGGAVQHHLAPLHGGPGRAPRQRGLQVVQDHAGEHEQSRQVELRHRVRPSLLPDDK